MPNHRTDKCCWLSRYGDGKTYVTAAQYITEYLCEIIAKSSHKTLCSHFWKLPEWSKLFRSQIPAANMLLTKYPAKSIILALQDRRCKNLRSLRALWLLEPVIKSKLYIKDDVVLTSDTIIKNEEVQQPRINESKTMFERLN